MNLSFSMKALPDEKATESISELNDRITNRAVHTGRADLGEQDLPRAPHGHQDRRPGGALPSMVSPVLP